MSPPRATLLEVTDTGGTTHLVTDEAMAVGRAAGRYLARCDALILAASLTTPESRPCRACRRRAASTRGRAS